MTTRKEFLKQSIWVSGSTLLFPSLSKKLFETRKYQPGLQLYTVREAMAKNPESTLSRVADIGYKLVESATYSGSELYYGMKPEVFSKLVDHLGLELPSNHYSLGAIKQNGEYPKGSILYDWDRAVDDAAKIGQKYMVCAYLDARVRKNLDDYKRLCDIFNRAGETCQKAGIQFCYHNHNFEFKKMDGVVPYEYLLKNTDKNLVKMEMDIYWVYKGGADPIKLFHEHPGRFVLWHVKDMDNTPRHFFAAVGKGIIDFKKIFRHADEAGLQHFFVEQDICPGSPFKSITESIRYLEKNIPSVA